MKPPKCKICGDTHWGICPSGGKSAAKAAVAKPSAKPSAAKPKPRKEVVPHPESPGLHKTGATDARASRQAAQPAEQSSSSPSLGERPSNTAAGAPSPDTRKRDRRLYMREFMRKKREREKAESATKEEIKT